MTTARLSTYFYIFAIFFSLFTTFSRCVIHQTRFSTKLHAVTSTMLQYRKTCNTYSALPVQNRVEHNPYSMHTASSQTVFVSRDCWSRSSEFQPRHVLLPATSCKREPATPQHGWNGRRYLHDQRGVAVFHHLCTYMAIGKSYFNDKSNHILFKDNLSHNKWNFLIRMIFQIQYSTLTVAISLQHTFLLLPRGWLYWYNLSEKRSWVKAKENKIGN